MSKTQTFAAGYALGRAQKFPMLGYSSKKPDPAFSRGWHIGRNIQPQQMANEMLARLDLTGNGMDAPL